MKTLERLFAEKLLKIKAIKLQPANPFTWASGWKSPFYCDNRKTLSYPSLRSFVKIEITRLILERFGQVDAIAGVATGGYPARCLGGRCIEPAVCICTLHSERPWTGESD